MAKRKRGQGPNKHMLAEIRVCWTLGYTYQQIAEMYDLTFKRAEQLVHHDLGRAPQYTFSEADFRRMRIMYEEKRMTYAEIAERMSTKDRSVSAGTVRYHIARMGVRLRRRGWSRKVDEEAKNMGVKK